MPTLQFTHRLFIFALCAIALIPAVSRANCYRQLTDNYGRDARHFELSEKSINRSLKPQTKAFAKKAVQVLIEKQQCYRGGEAYSVQDVGKTACRKIAPGSYFSRTCYVETEFGHFLVKVDAQEQIHLQFFRWD